MLRDWMIIKKIIYWLNIEKFHKIEVLRSSLSTPESEDQVKGWFFLDVVVTEWSSIFELLSSEDESLLIWGNSFLVLDLSFDCFNWVRWLNIESDGLSCKGLDKNLHLFAFFNYEFLFSMMLFKLTLSDQFLYFLRISQKWSDALY